MIYSIIDLITYNVKCTLALSLVNSLFINFSYVFCAVSMIDIHIACLNLRFRFWDVLTRESCGFDV